MRTSRPRPWRERLAAVLLSSLVLASMLSVATGAAPAHVAADSCASGQICTVTIDGTTYTVIGPCDTSTVDSITSGCLVINTTGSSGGLLICGVYACGPDTISQHALGPTPLEAEARAEIANLRGVPDDNANLYWSRGQIRADMYLRLLSLANASSGTLTTEQQKTVQDFTGDINSDRTAVAQAAVDLYNTWAGNPCGFHVPVGDPNAYLDQTDVASGITAPCNIPPNSTACLLGSCTPAPPSAEEFTAWAEGETLQAKFVAWGKGLSQEGGISLTDEQATASAAFEYDAVFGGIAEGIGYLTARHASLAGVASGTYSQAEADLSEQWLDALHDQAGEQFREVLKTALVQVFKAFDAAVEEGFASELEQGLAVALEEDAAGLIAESWETVVGPAVAAALVIAYETWQQVVNADVPIQLKAALDDAKAGHDLAYYASTPAGRQLILDALVGSTMPDFVATRLGSAAAVAPAPGPASPSDPVFHQTSPGGQSTTAGTFSTIDWSGNVTTTSVRDGWFVEQHAAGPLRYASSLAFVVGGTPSVCTTTTDVTTCTAATPPAEQWRAWLDGSDFLAERTAVNAGDGMVTDAWNSCGANSFLLPSGNIDLGYMCVYPSGASTFSFGVAAKDLVEIGGQVRTVTYVSKDGAGNVTSFAVDSPFGKDEKTGAVPSGVPVMVQTQVNGATCLTSSSLGSRVQGPDCVQSPTISVQFGQTVTLHVRPTLTITASSATVAYGDPAPTISPSYAGFAAGDTPASLTTAPTCSTDYTKGAGGGTYATRCSGAVDPDYNIVYVNGAVTEPFAPMTITAPSLTLHYGDAVPSLTPSYAGEPAGSLLLAPQCSTTYTPGSAPGSYPTACSGAEAGIGAITCDLSLNTCTGGDPLFSISYVSGSITVDPAPLTVTASSPEITYGDPVPAITPSYAGFVLDQGPGVLDTAPTCTTSYTAGSSTGSYPSSCAGASAPNYAIGYVDGSVTVDPAPLTVTAADATMVLHGSVPPLSGKIEGIVNGDAISATYSTTATSASPVGMYPITPTLVDPDGRLSNYAVTIVPGTMSVGYEPAGTTCLGAPGHTVLQPVAADGSSVFKANRVVALKFRVCDALGVSIGTPGVVARFRLVEIDDASGAHTVDLAPSSPSGETSFRWDSTGQQWIFNLATKSLAPGAAYGYRIELDDGSAVTFRFTLR